MFSAMEGGRTSTGAVPDPFSLCGYEVCFPTLFVPDRGGDGDLLEE